MAQRTIARMYDSYDTAAQTVSDLEASGIPHADISIVSNDARHQAATGTGADSSTGAGTGASVGTLLGGGAGLLAGIGALAIPGVGPVVAAGWLIATLTGAGIGAAAGGLLGSLTGAGVSEEDAHVYSEGVRRGSTLVTVRADDSMASNVEAIMAKYQPVDVTQRRAEYSQSGWSKFDETTGPYAGPTGGTTALGGTTASGTTLSSTSVPGASGTSVPPV